MSKATPDRDPITTHVLDSTTGLPAASIHVRLEVLTPWNEDKKGIYFTAITSADGRIMRWTPGDNVGATLAELWHLWSRAAAKEDREPLPLTWSLKFDTQAYWGEGKTFYPEVEVKILTLGKGEEKREHYHVPILLGPWGYTTYRGS